MFAPLGPIVMWRSQASRRRGKRADALRQFTRRTVAHLMAREARLGFEGDVLGRVFSFGDLQQAQPVICRIDLRGGAAVRRDDRFEIEALPRLGGRTRAESTNP